MSNELATKTDSFEMLDIFGEDGIAQEETRVDALATISAGKKGDNGYPTRSMDGTIILHDRTGRAPNLKAALEKDPKRLTIALPYEDLNKSIQQRYTRYSASRCEVYGDRDSLTEIIIVEPADKAKKKPAVTRREVHLRGSDQYKALLATCKVSVSVYFALARWLDDRESEVYFPDGLALYRLRFTSRNSLKNLRGNVQLVKSYTGGRVAGVPLDLTLDYRETVDGGAAKQNIPVWTLTMNPPFELSTKTVRVALESGIRAAAELMLPPPREETLETAALDAEFYDVHEEDGELPEMSERDLKQLVHGHRFETLTAPFFAVVKGSHLDIDGGRSEWLRRITEGKYSSLRVVLEASNDPTATLTWLLEEAKLELERKAAHQQLVQTVQRAKERDSLLSNYGPGIDQRHVDFLQSTVNQAVREGLNYLDRSHFISRLLGRTKETWVQENKQLGAADFQQLRDLVYVSDGKQKRKLTNEEMRDKVEDFNYWIASDEAFEVVLGV